MDIKQFLATEIAKLPKKRDDKESFPCFLRRIFDEFSKEISKIEGDDSLTKKVLEQNVTVKVTLPPKNRNLSYMSGQREADKPIS